MDVFKLKTNKPLIYIIDDLDDVREVVADNIKQRIKCKIKEFSDVDSALKELDGEKISPKAIISDVKMPKGSGFKLMKELPKRNLDITVIYITGLPGSLPEVENAITMAKPVDFDKLVKVLKDKTDISG